MEEPKVIIASPWWNVDDFHEAFGAAMTKPSRAKFEHLGRVVVELLTTAVASTRDATSHSTSESLVDKENMPEAVTYYHHPSAHPGEPHGSTACLQQVALDQEAQAAGGITVDDPVEHKFESPAQANYRKPGQRWR